MEPTFLAASPFLPLIGLSVLILVVHVMLQALIATKELGREWNAGPRDDDRQATGKLAGRAKRASVNFRETYPAFIALAFGVIMAGDPSGIALIGAWIWLVCRVIYIPLYLMGIPYIRSLVWVGSMIGLLLMFFVLMF
ncbi:putative MAPEG superfamily protein [Agrobacterium larrymoorei]|uniref:MAPEG superfamily protein n=1 Tax=Agrobacterium larrymoorei TaxID=160699 RepID=A0AAJ2BIC5_9HYPH|nr:MAPEG family protein [Agrobacterium larrymoorei]MDR6103521.1 putative MAPEG superfamily protein [Agrobacterium larrymoorei]